MTAAAPAAALPRSPDALDRLGEWIGERINPIVVKETRQGLRTRAFWIFFTLMLVACVIISLVAATNTGGWPSRGRIFFSAYDVCLGLVQFFVVPYSAYRSMARERDEETWALLTLTGLGPRKILRGKVACFTLQGALYTSAAAPFLLFSYYLNGIDLPTIVVVMIAGVVWQVLLTSLCVSLATLAASRLMRGALHFVVLGLLFQSTWLGLAMMVGAVEEMRSIMTSSTARITALGLLFALVTWAVLLYEAAAARMSLLTESYARGPRIALLVQLAGIMAMFAWGAIDAYDHDYVFLGSIVCSAHLFVVGIFLVSDHDGMTRALRLKKPKVSLLEPGAVRGFRFVMLLFVLIAAVFGGLAMKLDADHRVLSLVLAAPAYGVLYTALPVVLARLGSRNPADVPRVTRVAAIGLFIVGSGGPPLAAALARYNDEHSTLLYLFNPIMGLVRFNRVDESWVAHLLVLWCVALVFVLIAHEMMSRRDGSPEVR
jgi:hypothetical protein